MNMPLAMLLVAPANPPNPLLHGLATIGAMLECTAIQMFVVRVLSRRGVCCTFPMVLSVTTLLTICLDTLFGQPLQKFSLFSFGQIQGIRYYGIGNEYMGILIGVALVWFFTTVRSSRIQPVAWMVALALSFLLGWPGLGADAGGLIGAVVAFGAAGIVIRRGRVEWPAILGLAVMGMALAWGIAMIDSTLYGASAHRRSNARRERARLSGDPGDSDPEDPDESSRDDRTRRPLGTGRPCGAGVHHAPNCVGAAYGVIRQKG